MRGHCLQYCHFKRCEYIIHRYFALKKKNSTKTKAITNICEELKAVQIKVKVKEAKKKKEENVRKKSLIPGYREERMQDDTVRNGPFGYVRLCNEDDEEHFSLQRLKRILDFGWIGCTV